ncbi:DUF5344 family protein [Priestia megaterium]
MPDLGKNSLDTTEKWEAREQEIQTLISTYIKALNKNVKDTKSNVDLLKNKTNLLSIRSSKGDDCGKDIRCKSAV